AAASNRPSSVRTAFAANNVGARWSGKAAGCRARRRPKAASIADVSRHQAVPFNPCSKDHGMDLNLFDHKGTPLEKQRFTWRDMVQKPISKLDDDAFTRIRVVLLNGVESDAVRLQAILMRFNRELRLPLA